MTRPDDFTRDPPAPDAHTLTGHGTAGPVDTPPSAGCGPFAGPGGFPRVPGYEVLGVLGRGGMGTVYLARHAALKRAVAVKLVGGAAPAATLTRFRQEGEAVAKLQHPNIVQIFEVGACPAGAFIALEYVDGGTLREEVAGVPQPPRDTARLVETVARAVHHAHERRIVHRDLKPSNVLLTAGGVPKVADFGLARSLDSGGGVTLTADFVGTPAYAAPEQVSDQFGPIGPGTDVYALGVVLYELLTGRVPFQADSIPRLLRMVTEEEPVAPRRLKRDCPRDLETVALRCLEKDPRRRYATAADLADDLRRFVAGEPVVARPVGRVERAARWARRNPGVAALLGAVFALLTTVATVATVAAVRIDQSRRDEAAAKRDAETDRDAARRAERDGREKLLQAHVSEAKAGRYSRRVGQRFDTLGAVRKAADLARELGKPAGTFDELRNLAVAALALPDMKPDTAWVGWPSDVGKTWGPAIPDPTQRLATFAREDGVSVRRVGTGPDDCGEITRLPGLGSEVVLGWSADGRFLAVWHWWVHRIVVWRVGGDRAALAFEVPRDCVGFTLTPDGRQLIATTAAEAGRPSARVFDLGSGMLLRTVPLPKGAGQSLAHHPHRSELAVGLPGRVALVDLTSGDEVGSLPTPGGHLSWHPHGELLSVTAVGHVDVWDVPRKRQNWRLPNTGHGALAFFNPAGDVLVTSGWSGRVRLWNPYTGREVLATTGGHTWFGPGDRLGLRFPTSANDPSGPLTVVEPAREYCTLPVGVGLPAVTGLVNVSVHPGGRLAAASSAQGFALLDLATGAERAFVRAPGEFGVRHLLFEPDGSLLVQCALDTPGPRLTRWPVGADPADPTRLRVGPPEVVPVPAGGESVAASADGAVLAASEGPGAIVWRRDSTHDALRLPHYDCRHIAVSPNGKLVASGTWSGRGIKVWDAGTGRLVHDLLPDRGNTIPAFSADGRWLANRNGGQRWRVADWSEGTPAPAGTAGIGFSPDERLAAWSGKGFVVLTDAGTGRELARLEDPHQDGLGFLTFSPDSTLLMGATNDSFHCVRVWDLRKLRAGLAEFGLDWDGPPYPPAAAAAPPTGPLQVRVEGEDLFTNPARLEQYHRDQTLLALWTNPLDPKARHELGEWLLKANRPREAEAELTAALVLRPGQVAGHRLRADARFRLGDWKGCLADADAVLAKWPTDRQATAWRAIALAALGRHADAVPALTAALEHYPDDVILLLSRAEARHALGQPDPAVADWKRAAGLATPQTGALPLNNLARRLLTGPPAVRHPRRALELSKWANDKQPGNPTFLNTLGVAHYRTGEFAAAVPVLERGLAAGKGWHDAFDLFFLAMCRAKLGDRGKAAADYRRAVEWVGEKADLSAANRTELAAFRAEAEGALHAAGVATDPAPPPRGK